MSSINTKQKEALGAWAEKCYDSEIFPNGTDAGVSSYYQYREYGKSREIMEYDFSDVRDILSMLHGEWGDRYDDQIKKIIAVSILNAENAIFLPDLDRNSQKEDKIPDFIYAF